MAAEIFFAEEGTVWTGRYQEENIVGVAGTTVTVVNGDIGPISDPSMGALYDQTNDVSVWVDGVEETVVSYTGKIITIASTLTGGEAVVVKYADWVIARPCEVTNIDVSGGTRDVELIRAFHACAIKNEKPMDIVETSVTVIKTDVDWAYMWLGTPTGVGTPVTPTYPINLAGDQLKGKWVVVYDYQKPVGSLTEELRIVFKDAVCTEAPFSNASNGYIEETATFKVVPVDFLQQYTNDTTGSPLTKVFSGAGE